MMVRTLVTLLLASMTLPAAAGDGFTLGLAEIDFTTADTAEPSGPGVMVDASIVERRAETLAYQAALRPVDPTERTEALWGSEMGRLYYELAAQQAMLGREGLVNGGRMTGVGLATAGLGDGDPNGALGMALGRGKWVEMNANQKLQAGIEASILGALIAFMISYAD